MTPSYMPTFANPERLKVEDALETVRAVEQQFQRLFADPVATHGVYSFPIGQLQRKEVRTMAELLDRLRAQIEGLQ